MTPGPRRRGSAAPAAALALGVLLAAVVAGVAPAVAATPDADGRVPLDRSAGGDDPPAVAPAVAATPGPDWRVVHEDPDEANLSVDVATLSVQEAGGVFFLRVAYHGNLTRIGDTDVYVPVDVDRDNATGEPPFFPGDIGSEYLLLYDAVGPDLFAWDDEARTYQPAGPLPYGVVDAANDTVTVGVSLASLGDPDAVDFQVSAADYAGSEEFDWAPDLYGDPAKVTVAFGDASVAPPEGPWSRVDIVVDGAPRGLQAFDVTLDAGGPAVAVAAPGARFAAETVDGGVGATALRVRGADFEGAVGPTAEEVGLFSAVVAGPADPTLVVEALRDDDGDPVDPVAVHARVAAFAPFERPLAAAGPDGGTPTDPDGDGRFEDVDGDGDADFADAVTLAFVDGVALDPAATYALDHDGDGTVGVGDAIALAFAGGDG